MKLFNTPTNAFEYYYYTIMNEGVELNGTKAIFNQSFTIMNPLENKITTPWRKWRENYAELEWEWYLSGNRSIKEISKSAKLWKKVCDTEGNVNSNYGYQWNRNDQLNKALDLIRKDRNTRKASVSFYDGKEIDLYDKDTVCTYGVHFYVLNDKLNMTVLMRSCDLIYGFCNDQYCFSRLQDLASGKLDIKTGTSSFMIVNLHVYEKHYKIGFIK